MKTKIMISAVLMVFVLSSAALAHNVFVEVPLQVEEGEELEFKSFYSNPDDPIEERDMTPLELAVRLPDGTMQDIDMDQHATYYQTVKTFEQSGEYVFILEREPYQHRTTEIRDFGKSIVWTGEERPEHEELGLPLEISPLSVTDMAEKGSVEVQVLYDGEPLPGAEMRVHTSLEPYGRIYDPDFPRVEADDEGVFQLDLDRDYNHILEIRHQVPASEAEEKFGYNTGLLTRNIRFRTTLYLPAE